jgi:hypothetical protein
MMAIQPLHCFPELIQHQALWIDESGFAEA